jgi:hypothetical protein
VNILSFIVKKILEPNLPFSGVLILYSFISLYALQPNLYLMLFS